MGVSPSKWKQAGCRRLLGSLQSTRRDGGNEISIVVRVCVKENTTACEVLAAGIYPQNYEVYDSPCIQDPLHNFTSTGCSLEHFPATRKRAAERGVAPSTKGIPHATSRRWRPRPHQCEHGLHGPTTHLEKKRNGIAFPGLSLASEIGRLLRKIVDF